MTEENGRRCPKCENPLGPDDETCPSCGEYVGREPPDEVRRIERM